MWIDKDAYTSHIKDGEKLIKMRRLLDKIEMVENKHMIESTDFFDPYEIYLAKSILNRFDSLNFIEYGGFDKSERRIIMISQSYQSIEEPREYLACIKLEGDFSDLSHKDFLGAFLSLSIIREKIGDILVDNDSAYIIVKKEIGDFVLLNLDKVANRNVKPSYISFDNIEIPPMVYREVKAFLTSLRIDLLISAAYNLSRKDSMDLIKRGLVKINWQPINKPASQVSEGDIISVRGFGRFILYGIDGISRKGRYMSKIRILI